jgi:hypothetical protein|tara:strand:+ start:262 stop:480 length:219 start_codon:yes stop_codon:yes gene_type:complete
MEKIKKIVSGVAKFHAPHPDSGKTINRVRVHYTDGSVKEFDAIEWDMMVQEGRKLWIQHEKELSKNPERFDG